jgi:hypothetical protein
LRVSGVWLRPIIGKPATDVAASAAAERLRKTRRLNGVSDVLLIWEGVRESFLNLAGKRRVGRPKGRRCDGRRNEQRYLTRSKFSEAKFNKTCLAEYAETCRTVCVDAGYYQFPGESIFPHMNALRTTKLTRPFTCGSYWNRDSAPEQNRPH